MNYEKNIIICDTKIFTLLSVIIYMKLFIIMRYIQDLIKYIF